MGSQLRHILFDTESHHNVSDYRNPFIAEAMKVLGYVNRFSRGVYRVQKELGENGNGKAIFDFSLVTAFRVVENVSKRYFEGGFGVEITKEKLVKKQVELLKRPRNVQEEILQAIKNNPSITRKELEIQLDYSHGSIKYHIQVMSKASIIKHIGSTKSGKWIIL
ncbi:winged helix-turn-helix domain-containing protein [Proteiniphilum acetatigenes]|uniref:winged helix-turn-helix domain-containing protein n=1 Tax=Proteiniphilum acetatigenes TaxID=294710 RepID=UPI0003A4E924|nr:winged helix-turn-helix domain-containing protein [Proteiniphilum acetatigenes]